MLPRDARPPAGGGSRGRGSPLWSATGGSSAAASLWGGATGSGNGNGGSGNGGGARAAAAAARRSALLFNAALAAACVALVVTAASLRELRALVEAQKLLQQQHQQQLGGFGGGEGMLPLGGGGHGGGRGADGWAPAAAAAATQSAASAKAIAMAPAAATTAVAILAPSSASSSSISAAATAAAASGGATNPAATQRQCAASAMPATEMWGDVVRPGSTHRLDSAAACCAACRAHEPPADGREDALGCNVWVWCGDAALCGAQHRECWLKHLAHPSVARPMREGAGVGWTSGVVDLGGELAAGGGEGDSEDGGRATTAAAAAPPPVGVAAELERSAAAAAGGALGDDAASRRYHTVTTAQGPAVHWQTRVHYYHFLKQKAACEEAARREKNNGQKGGGCDMGGWTRLLHSGEADDLMDELPTFLADPLPESVVPHAWYPVLNRPYALLQWIEKADIPERYILMSEPDHLLLRPLPNLAPGLSVPAAFPFFYIEPHKEEYLPLAARFARVPPDPKTNASRSLTRREAMLIAPIGNSPTFLSTALARAVVPEWQRLSVAVFRDAQANKAWGWVQEMYAFAIALYNLGVRRTVLAPELAAQPPWDSDEHARRGKGPPFYMIHYTYGCDYSLNGTHARGQFGEWRFDKRTYAAKPPPRHLGNPPPGVENVHVRSLVRAINEATEAIPCWEAYRALGGRLAECGDERATGVWAGVEDRRRRVKMEREAREAKVVSAGSGGSGGGGGGGGGGDSARNRGKRRDRDRP